MLRKMCLAGAVAVGLTLVPATAAFADNCYNASRPAPASGEFTAKGNWAYVPDFGVWAFSPPENYLNSGGAESWLLENTPYCQQGGVLAYTGPRTTTNGVQSGCGAFG